MQAGAFVEQQRLGLASQSEFKLDTSALRKRDAEAAGIAAWPEEDNDGRAFSDDDFDVAAGTQACLMPSLHALLLQIRCCIRIGCV